MVSVLGLCVVSSEPLEAPGGRPTPRRYIKHTHTQTHKSTQTDPREEDGVDAVGDAEGGQQPLALRLFRPAVDGVAAEELCGCVDLLWGIVGFWV